MFPHCSNQLAQSLFLCYKKYRYSFYKFWFANGFDPNSSAPGMLSKMNLVEGLLGNVSQFVYIDPENVGGVSQTSYNPYFEPKNSMFAMQQEINDIISKLNSMAEDEIQNSTMLYALPDAAISFNRISYSENTLSYSFVHNDQTSYQTLPPPFRGRLNKVVNIRNSIMSMINTAFSNILFILYPKNCQTFTFWNVVTTTRSFSSYVTTSMETFPYIQVDNDLKVIDIVGIVVFPFCLSFLVPVLMNIIVIEKEYKLRMMMKMVKLIFALLFFHPQFF